jgi:anti-sigma factor RsiW
MRCSAARKLFTRDLDGALFAAGKEALSRHLSQCAECRAERQRWESFSRALRASGPTAVPAELAARSWAAAVRARPAPSPTLAAWFVAAARPAAFAGAAAALVVWLIAAGIAPRQLAAEPSTEDPMELALQLWTGEVAGDGP